MAAAGAVIALAAVAAAAVLVARRPEVLAGAVIVALPFRIPISAGGVTSNLLVPLYFVVAAGSLAFIVTTLRGRAPPDPRTGIRATGPATGTRATGTRATGPAPPGPRTPEPAPPEARPPAMAPRWLEWLLAGYVVLYALQAAYSPKFTTALQQVVFFYVPFALAYCLLRRLDWTQRLTRTCLALLAGLAVLFALVGFVEYGTKTIFLNPKLIAANQLHAYFTVNSVFFDPNIFGRFLALVMILLASVILYARRQRTVLVTGAVLAILWVALLLTLSRSAIGALLVGLERWPRSAGGWVGRCSSPPAWSRSWRR